MRLTVFCVAIGFLFFSANLNAQADRLEKKAARNLRGWTNPMEEYVHMGNVGLDSLKVDATNKRIDLYYGKSLSYWPWRNRVEDIFKESLEQTFRGRLKSYDLNIYTNGREVHQLIPNIFRDEDDRDKQRLLFSGNRESFVHRHGVLNYALGLSDNFIALWHSHGWYYESKLDRWEWQRARLFGSVEDLLPMMYVLSYIVPMLENAGANVFLPRERSFQKNEVVVDNDKPTQGSEFVLAPGLTIAKRAGFLPKDTLFVGENPFKLGTSLTATHASGKVATYLPCFPDKGEYEVYVSYGSSSSNTKKAVYKVNHSGGSTSFTVNQTISGGTWVYLGRFLFNKGVSAQAGSVEVNCEHGDISLDAIRFGGGMGNVARRPGDLMENNQWSLKSGQDKPTEGVEVNPDHFTWKTSQRPRYMEAARYWLQYAGMPDTLVYSLNSNKNDYNDDYQSRGEWVGYLMGTPNGPTKNRNVGGLNIPIDMAFAFHTDAGITPDDSIIGTLGIFSSERDEGMFPGGQSKLSSRDLTDIIQTQIVDDIRALYQKKWTRRGMWDKQYSEAWRPNVPTMLLELFSHQNLADMKLGLDPRFRFDVSRAVYKGMLKFLAFQEGREYAVQPLPVDHMSVKINSDHCVLSWKPVLDPLEESAIPTQYKVYKRIGNSGFDNGTLVKGTSYEMDKPQFAQQISFKVTAINEGGESMPSEILSMALASKEAPVVLIVNAFDRISAPAFVDKDGFAGLAWWDDQGVPDKYEYAYTGHQYDFNRKSPWLDDDSPGWGASYADMEGRIIPGNGFDNVYVHGQAILNAGYSYVSVSDEVFESQDFNAKNYMAIDVIAGEEKATLSYKNPNVLDYKIYTPAFMRRLREVTANGMPVFLSGAYVGSEMHMLSDTVAQQFANEVLHFKWRTNHAVNAGGVEAAGVSPFFNSSFTFNTAFHPEYYTVEAPDAIVPANSKANTVFRYTQNGTSAGVMYDGKYKTIVLGFPFETITSQRDRDALMKEILEFFK